MNITERFANLTPNKQTLLALWLERHINDSQAQDEAAADKHLVAYVVLKGGEAGAVTQLREYLRQQAPAYMLPDKFIPLDSLPLTANGKIDRRRLSVISTSQMSDDKFVAPRTKLEEDLAALWVEILRVERVGIYDNFFDLGGHSLLATRFIFRVRELFDVELPVRALFEAPTIAGLAVVLVQSQMEQINSDEMAQVLADLERP